MAQLNDLLVKGNTQLINPLSVSSGGTGLSNITTNAILVGNGTGALTVKSAVDASNMLLNALTTGSNPPKSEDYVIAQYVGGGTTTTTYHRRPWKAFLQTIHNRFYATCTTAAATAAKVATTSLDDGYKFILNTGAFIAVKFTNAITVASATLNVDSTGAKSIYYRGAALAANKVVAGATILFVYNGTQYEIVSDLDTNTTYTIPNNYSTVNVKVGNTTTPVGPHTSTDTLTFIQGTNVTLTATANSSGADSITIASTDTNTTYTLTQDANDGHKITLTPSSGSATTITIPDNNTTYSAGVGLALSSTTFKAKLRSETTLTNDSAAATETSGRVYPVAVDKSGYLAVNVPWTDNNTDTKVKISNKEADNDSTWYPTFYTTTASAATDIFTNNGFVFRVLNGTTSTDGYAFLRLGNTTKTGVAGNKYGKIVMYSNNGGYHNIVPVIPGTTGSVTHTLTDTSGWLVGAATAGVGGANNPVYINSSGIATATNITSSNLIWYGTCSTAGATRDKVINCPGYILEEGNIIIIKFDNSNSKASPRMNVNSTGLKDIYYNGAVLPTTNYINDYDLSIYRYNGTNYEYIGSNKKTYMELDPYNSGAAAGTVTAYPLFTTGSSENQFYMTRFSSGALGLTYRYGNAAISDNPDTTDDETLAEYSGYARLRLGNNLVGTAGSAVDGNLKAEIRLYNNAGKYIDFKPSEVTTSRSISMPIWTANGYIAGINNTSGDIGNSTTKYVYFEAGLAKEGTLPTINYPVTSVTGTSPITVSPTTGDVVVTHDNSGVTAQEYAGTSNSGNVAYGATITIPKFTVNATGHITSAGTTTFKLPTSDNTNTTYKLIVGAANTATANANATNGNVWVNLTNTTGTAAVQDKINFKGSGLTVTNAKTDNNTSVITWTWTHPTITRSDTTSTASPAHGGTFTAVDSVTTNNGHVTAINVKTVTLPAQYTHPTFTNTQTTATSTLAHSGTFNVDTLTYDTNGHVTGSVRTTYTLPPSGNTDTKGFNIVGASNAAYANAAATDSNVWLNHIEGTSTVKSKHNIVGLANSSTSVVSDANGKIIIGGPVYGTCTTAAATAAKTVAIDGFVLRAGAIANVRFTITNTKASPTLNINSTGAKPIYINTFTPNTDPTVAGTYEYKAITTKDFGILGPAKDYVTFVYDTTVVSTGAYLIINATDVPNIRQPQTTAYKTELTTSQNFYILTSNAYTTAANNGIFADNNARFQQKSGHAAIGTEGEDGYVAPVTGTIYFVMGNASAKTAEGNAEAILALYSAGTKGHYINGAETTTWYTHTLPNTTGYLITGSTSGAGNTMVPIYVPNNGIATATNVALPLYATCTTAAATAAKVATSDPKQFKLNKGALIAVKFTNAITVASATLNVDSTGAKAIYYRGAALAANKTAAGATILFMYNGTQYEILGDLDTNSHTYTVREYNYHHSDYTDETANIRDVIFRQDTAAITANSYSNKYLATDAGSFQYTWTYPAANTEGISRLTLGNSVALDTAGNQSGQIRLYNAAGNMKTIYANTEDSSGAIELPYFDTPYGKLVGTNKDNVTGTGSAYVPVYVDPDGIATATDISMPLYATCTTAAATAAKVATTDPMGYFKLKKGALVAVRFTNAITVASATLNVDSTGAKAIYYRGAALAANKTVAGATILLMYNGTQFEVIGDLDTDTNTDAAVSITNTNPTSATTYYPVWHTSTSGTSVGLRANNGLMYNTLEGTTSALGRAYLYLGNATASGTAANKEGKVYLYSQNTKGHWIAGDSTTTDYTHTLPNVTGYLLTGNSVTNPTTATTYNISFVNGTSDGIARTNNGLSYITLEGVANTEGYGILSVGNNTAKTAAGNKTGRIRIYGDGTTHTEIKGATPTANRTLFIPTLGNSGTIAARQSDVTYTADRPLYVDSNGILQHVVNTLKLYSSTLVKGTAPSSDTNIQYSFTDSNSNVLASIRNKVTTAKLNSLALDVYNYTASGSTAKTVWLNVTDAGVFTMAIPDGTISGNLAFSNKITVGNQAVGTSAARNIYAGTSALTSGTSTLTTGVIYLQYEV